MINKQYLKVSLGMLVMLVSLTGCILEGNKGLSPSDQKAEELQTNIEKPTTYLIVGFAGLTDPGTHPADWSGKIQKMIADKTATSTNKPQIHQLLIRRSDENKTIQEHGEEASQQILCYLLDQGIEDLGSVKLILVAESYGGLVAAQLALTNTLGDMAISIAGLITVRTPWEGVNLVQAISSLTPFAQQFKELLPDMLSMLDSYNKCQQALETLSPDGSFIRRLKDSDLNALKFPVLALAGKDIQPTFPYAKLQAVPMLVSIMPQLAQQIGQVSTLLVPYRSGNDGLVLTSSAMAANSVKGPQFESYVLSGFSHFGETTNHIVALGHVRNFVDKIVK